MTLVAVTTRSKLRDVRFFPMMLIATVRARRQLGRARGIVRWASVIGSPTEFWTLTVWTGVHELQEFMRSGVHGDVMWRMPRWLSSFWLARWRPGPHELGTWDGLALAAAGERKPQADGPEEGTEFVRRALAEGALTYERSPLVERSRAAVERFSGVAIRVTGSPLQLGETFHIVRGLRRAVAADPRTVRAFVGAARFHDVYLFVLLDGSDAASRLLDSEWMQRAHDRWPGRVWAIEWLPENEFGHWDGMRMRAFAPRPRRFRRPRAGTETPATEGARRGVA